MTKPAASELPKFTADEAEALKALMAGTASEGQQKAAFEWIINRACAFRSIPFREDADGGDRATTFALGRQFVAHQMMYLATMPANLIAEKRKKANE